MCNSPLFYIAQTQPNGWEFSKKDGILYRTPFCANMSSAMLLTPPEHPPETDCKLAFWKYLNGQSVFIRWVEKDDSPEKR